MRKHHRLRLSAPQLSALECSGILEGPSDDGPSVEREALIVRCWMGLFLEFDAAERDRLFAALMELANSEEATSENCSYEHERRKLARHACRSLSALAGRVLRAR